MFYVLLSEMPDSVSISESTSPMEAGRTYRLRCDVRNIAPLRNVSLSWYSGNEVIQTHTHDSDIATPQNVSFYLSITPTKYDDGRQIQCKVQMNLGLSTPMMSQPLDLVVNCESLKSLGSQTL